MSLRSKVKANSIGMFTALAFYAIVGILSLAVLPTTNFPPHISAIGILSLITAYGLYKKRFWAIWIVFMLFFISTAFSMYTLYFYYEIGTILGINMAIYLILTWTFTCYLTVKRKLLK